MSTIDHLNAQGKLVEVKTLCSPQWVRRKKRNHNPKQIGAPADVIGAKVLAVIVVSEVPVHASHTEKHLQRLQAFQAARALSHYELMGQLIAGFVASAVRAIWLSHDTD